jgi:hypothetical protein
MNRFGLMRRTVLKRDSVIESTHICQAQKFNAHCEKPQHFIYAGILHQFGSRRAFLRAAMGRRQLKS